MSNRKKIMKYFATITQNISSIEKYKLMKQIAVDNTITSFTGAEFE